DRADGRVVARRKRRGRGEENALVVGVSGALPGTPETGEELEAEVMRGGVRLLRLERARPLIRPRLRARIAGQGVRIPARSRKEALRPRREIGVRDRLQGAVREH